MPPPDAEKASPGRRSPDLANESDSSATVRSEDLADPSAATAGPIAPQRSEPKSQDGEAPPVAFAGPDDPANPQNWSPGRKWLYACILGSMTMSVTFASTIFSTATVAAAREFGVSNIVMILGTCLFIVGFAVGPILFGPMSELYGRYPPLVVGSVLFVLFQLPVALGDNVATIIVFRFLGGVASSAPLAVAGGYFADLFDPIGRGLALVILSATTFLGPMIGPIVGGYMTEDERLGWRWTAWMTMIVAGVAGLLGCTILPETYPPVILKRKAKKLRQETGDQSIKSPLDNTKIDFSSIFTRYLARPFHMILLEPILVLITLYMTFIYGFIYLLFESFPVSYLEERGWTLGDGSLPFLAVGAGVVLGSTFISWFTLTRMRRELRQTGRIRPETRLYPMMVGAFAFPAGCFWFAWTSFPELNAWPQILAGVPLGMGIQIIFLQGMAYLVDVYLMNANSALAANIMIRSVVAGGFTMFATPMYHNLGVRWASTLLGLLGVLFIPVPFLFYRYGERIRKMSKYSPKL